MCLGSHGAACQDCRLPATPQDHRSFCHTLTESLSCTVFVKDAGCPSPCNAASRPKAIKGVVCIGEGPPRRQRGWDSYRHHARLLGHLHHTAPAMEPFLSQNIALLPGRSPLGSHVHGNSSCCTSTLFHLFAGLMGGVIQSSPTMATTCIPGASTACRSIRHWPDEDVPSWAHPHDSAIAGNNRTLLQRQHHGGNAGCEEASREAPLASLGGQQQGRIYA